MLKSTISDDELAITSVDDLPLEYTINVQNIVILIMSIFMEIIIIIFMKRF